MAIPSKVHELLSIGHGAGVPIFMEGAPGVGKTSVGKQFADSLGKKFMGVSVLLKDAVDFSGTPCPSYEVPFNGTTITVPAISDKLTLEMISKGRAVTKWFAPGFLPTSPGWVIMFDELPSAPPLVQSALLQLILEGFCGDYTLPDDVYCIAAGNRVEDKSYVQKMGLNLSSRFMGVSFETNVRDWVNWSLHAGIDIFVINFIRLRPELLNKYDPASGHKVWPNPRSWEFVSRVSQQNPNNGLLFEACKGLVGDGAAGEYCAFREIFHKIPKPHNCLSDPDNAPVPKDSESDVKFSLCGALLRLVNANNMGNYIRYVSRLGKEFETMSVLDAMETKPEVAETRALVAWQENNQEIFLSQNGGA